MNWPKKFVGLQKVASSLTNGFVCGSLRFYFGDANSCIDNLLLKFSLHIFNRSTMADEETDLPPQRGTTKDGPSQALLSKYKRGTNVDHKVQGPQKEGR
jgi:hypothetical protein